RLPGIRIPSEEKGSWFPTRAPSRPGLEMSEPPSEPPLTLEELVSRITDENRHEEIDWGPPVGREILDSGPRLPSSEVRAAKMSAMKAMTCRIVDGRVEVPAKLAT